MKTTNYLGSALGLGIAASLLVVVTGCTTTGNRPTTRVYEEKKYIQLHHVQGICEVGQQQTNAAIGMACNQCKTLRYQALTSPELGLSDRWPVRPGIGSFYWAWTERQRDYDNWARRHYCPGCKSTITVTGLGKDRQESVKHTCENCGNASLPSPT